MFVRLSIFMLAFFLLTCNGKTEAEVLAEQKAERVKDSLERKHYMHLDRYVENTLFPILKQQRGDRDQALMERRPWISHPEKRTYAELHPKNKALQKYIDQEVFPIIRERGARIPKPTFDGIPLDKLIIDIGISDIAFERIKDSIRSSRYIYDAMDSLGYSIASSINNTIVFPPESDEFLAEEDSRIIVKNITDSLQNNYSQDLYVILLEGGHKGPITNPALLQNRVDKVSDLFLQYRIPEKHIVKKTEMESNQTLNRGRLDAPTENSIDISAYVIKK